jgi:hypothetical protein
MNPRVAALGNLIRSKRDQRSSNFVLMIGAGASFTSGMPPTDALKQALLDRFGPHAAGSGLAERWDAFWENMPPGNRELTLQTYFSGLKPSPGYLCLAEMLKQGFFDVVITMNFDNMLESALDAVGVGSPEKGVPVRSDWSDEAVCRAMKASTPRIKILKLHGSAKSAGTFLFTGAEMVCYPECIEELVKDLTSRDVLICGYGFEDMCMLRAFSTKGESIFCVNPAGASAKLKALMACRHSELNVIDGNDARFDDFFESLATAVREGTVVPKPPAVNPFRFLEGYGPGDSDWFVLRRRQARDLVRRLECAPPRALHLIGKRRVGKTSFVRAGLIPALEAKGERFQPIYVRCIAGAAKLREWLPRKLMPYVDGAKGDEDVQALLEAAAKRSRGRIVLVLDQFERVLSDVRGDRLQVLNLVRQMHAWTPPEATVVYVVASNPEGELPYFLALSQLNITPVPIDPLSPGHVRKMIGALSRKAGIVFEREAVERIVDKYTPDGPFGLTHVQAICHLLCSTSHVDVQAVERVEQDELVSLDQALKEYDLFGLMEDIESELQQTVVRQEIKYIETQSRVTLAGCLRKKFPEIFRNPEPLPIARMSTRQEVLR